MLSPQDELLNAIYRVDVDAVRQLLLNGVSPNLPKDDERIPPLNLACQKNSPELVDLLLKAKADPNAKSKGGYAPLHYVMFCGDTDSIFESALEDDGECNYERLGQIYETNPILQNDLKIVRLLIAAKADIDILDNQKRTPLCLAGAHMRLDLVLELFKQNASTKVPRGAPMRFLFSIGFAKLKSLMKKNPNFNIHDMMNYLKMFNPFIKKIFSGEDQEVDPKAIQALQNAIVKDDKVLERYINELKRIMDEHLAKKAFFAPGKAKLEAVKVFIERLKAIETLKEALELVIPFTELFPDKKLAAAADDMLKRLGKFQDQDVQECDISLIDILSLNRNKVGKDKPTSLQQFEAFVAELTDENPVTEDDNSLELK